MVFNSLLYALFLPTVVVLYYAAPHRSRLALLLVASYVFYASWNPVYLVLIVGLTYVNWQLAIALRWAAERPRGGAVLLWVGVAVNLGLLGYFKYTHFVLENLAASVSWLGFHPDLASPSLVLPLGLSFFVFEFIHYLVDVRRGHPLVESPVKFALFAAFFPTQVAGPIKRYEQFMPQIERPIAFDWGNVGEGSRLILVGLFKKIALADNLAPLVLVGFRHAGGGGEALGTLDAWLVVLAFAFQIYFDFSGYTDMGRGSARLLGFDVPENFRRPYLATNVSEFWRRWHISLSTWLRDYVYIALGGNRRHRDRNLFLTMVLGGLWHGASWTFVIWGALHGVLLIAYRRIARQRPGVAPAAATPAALGWLATFTLVCVGWVFFRAADFREAASLLTSMFVPGVGQASALLSSQRLTIALIALGTILIELWHEHQARSQAEERTEAWSRRADVSMAMLRLRPVGYVLLFMATLLLQPSTSPRFIYFQF